MHPRQMIRRAMQDSDQFVLVFDYADQKGQRTRRVVSPIRFQKESCMLALCLSREEPRYFQLDRVQNLRLAPAHDYLMPVPLVAVA